MRRIPFIFILLAVHLSGAEIDAVFTPETVFSEEMNIAVPQNIQPRGNYINYDYFKLKIPQNWYIAYYLFPPNCSFDDIFYECDEEGFHIVSTRQLWFQSRNLIKPDVSEFEIRIKVKAPAKSKTNAASISAQIDRSGIVVSGPEQVGSTEIKPGEEKEIVFPFSLTKGFPNFSVRLGVSGDLIIQHVSLHKAANQLPANKTLVEGTIVEHSQLPPATTADYADCRFVCKFRGNGILAGSSCPQEVALVVEGFRNRKYLPSAKLKTGDHIRLLIRPYHALSSSEQMIQQADDLNLFTLASYYADGGVYIRKYVSSPISTENSVRFESQQYIPLSTREINHPLEPSAIQEQQTVIRKDLEKINARLAQYPAEKRKSLQKEFAAAWKQNADSDLPGRNRRTSNGWRKLKLPVRVWRNMDGSFWELPEKYDLNSGEQRVSSENVRSLIALRDCLAANGCQLIVSLVPDMYDISARVINRDFRRVPDFRNAEIVKQLLESGIEAVYGSDAIVQNYNRYPWAFFFNGNDHPSDTTQDILTDLCAEKLKRFQIPADLDTRDISYRWSPHAYGSDPTMAFPENCDIGNNQPGSVYRCRQVFYQGTELATQERGPVLVVGNSFSETPMNYPDSFPTLLTAKTGIKIAHWRQTGGAGPLVLFIQELFNDPEKYLRGTKVVVFAIGEKHLLHNWMLNIQTLEQSALLLSGKQNLCSVSIDKKELSGTLNAEGFREYSLMIPTGVEYNQNKPLVCAVSVNPKGERLSVSSGKNAAMFPPLPGKQEAALKVNVQNKRFSLRFAGNPGQSFQLRSVKLFQ